mmetsp:Transcript_71539/g.232516  ORF Transcript_71539/g.232516 Transcript_71539/m.232516 type:complete len:212 (+) Transcript_71539:648-1283(+)
MCGLVALGLAAHDLPRALRIGRPVAAPHRCLHRLLRSADLGQRGQSFLGGEPYLRWRTPRKQLEVGCRLRISALVARRVGQRGCCIVSPGGGSPVILAAVLGFGDVWAHLEILIGARHVAEGGLANVRARPTLGGHAGRVGGGPAGHIGAVRAGCRSGPRLKMRDVVNVRRARASTTNTSTDRSACRRSAAEWYEQVVASRLGARHWRSGP